MRDLLLWILLLLCGCAGDSERIVIGSKIDTEGAILGYIQLHALTAAGIPVEDRIETGPTLIARRALEYAELDGYIEYTGTALVNFMGETSSDILTDPQKSLQVLRNRDSRENNLVWLEPWSGINNTYTVLLRRDFAGRNNLHSISDLRNYLTAGRVLRFGSDPEFAARVDGLPGMLERYELSAGEAFQVLQMDAGLVYQSLKQANIDAAIGYATDGRIAALDLVRLQDDRHFFPVYNPVPVFRAAALQRYPQIPAVLNRIAAKIDAEAISEMNYRHDVGKERASDLAREWLRLH